MVRATPTIHTICFSMPTRTWRTRGNIHMYRQKHWCFAWPNSELYCNDMRCNNDRSDQPDIIIQQVSEWKHLHCPWVGYMQFCCRLVAVWQQHHIFSWMSVKALRGQVVNSSSSLYTATCCPKQSLSSHFCAQLGLHCNVCVVTSMWLAIVQCHCALWLIEASEISPVC